MSADWVWLETLGRVGWWWLTDCSGESGDGPGWALVLEVSCCKTASEMNHVWACSEAPRLQLTHTARSLNSQCRTSLASTNSTVTLSTGRQSYLKLLLITPKENLMISCDSHGNSTLTPPPMPGKLRDTQWYVLPGTVRGHSPGHHPCNWVRRLDKSFKVHFVGGLSEPGEHGQCQGCGQGS